MKRLPLFASFLLFILLCASIAYWGLQLFRPPLRPVAAPPRAVQAEIRPEAAGTLFGGRAGGAAVASNYQLKGVIFSGSPNDSVAILSADGKPAQAIRVGSETTPGVTIKEVHRDYVLLSDGGAIKRVELPESAKGQGIATTAPLSTRPSTPAPAPIPQAPPVPQAATPQISAPIAPPVSKSSPPTSGTGNPPSASGAPQMAAPPQQTVTAPAAPTTVVVPQQYSAPAQQPRSVAEGAPLQSR